MSKSISSLDKAGKILARIKDIDAKVIAIDRMAHECADGVAQVVFNVSVSKKADTEGVTASLDADGSLRIAPLQARYEDAFARLFSIGEPVRKKEDPSLGFEMGDTAALTVFGAMLLHYKEEREAEIDKLRALGFSI